MITIDKIHKIKICETVDKEPSVLNICLDNRYIEVSKAKGDIKKRAGHLNFLGISFFVKRNIITIIVTNE